MSTGLSLSMSSPCSERRDTGFSADHSAYDAYSFRIEAAGRALFYTGDFRAHGRKAERFERLVGRPPTPVHTLLMEGTTMSRSSDGAPPTTESQLEDILTERLNQTEGLALACFSAQNIDRYVTFFRAARRAGRQFVGDLYLASVLDAISRTSLPGARDGALRVYVPNHQRIKLKRTGRFELEAPFHSARIYATELAREPGRYVLLFRSGMTRELERMNVLRGARIFYSLWPGYLERDGSDLRGWATGLEVPLEVVHTSGHADPETLRRLAVALAPDRVVPMHTIAPERYAKSIANVLLVPDGEWADV